MRLPWASKPKGYQDDDIDEWDRHHNDPRHFQAEALFFRLMTSHGTMTDEQLQGAWREANSLVGKRAPADYSEFVAYGYAEALQSVRQDDKLKAMLRESKS